MNTITASENRNSQAPGSASVSYHPGRSRSDSDRGIRIARVLASEGSRLLKIQSRKVELCYEKDNQFVGKGLEDLKTGEVFDWNGRLWRCSLRVCPSCNARHWNVARTRFEDAMREACFQLRNYKAFAITLTFPSSLFVGLDFQLASNAVNSLWRRLYRSKGFKDLCSGGLVRCEVTNGLDSCQPVRLHLHLIVFCKKDTSCLDFNRLWQLWRDFLKKRVPMLAEYELEYLQVSLRRLSTPGDLTTAFHYIVKRDHLETLTDELLLQLAESCRFPRMIADFGCFKKWRRSQKTSEMSPHILDTEVIADSERANIQPAHSDCKEEFCGSSSSTDETGSPGITPRYLTDLPLEVELSRIVNKVKKSRKWRMKQLRELYPTADFVTSNGVEF